MWPPAQPAALCVWQCSAGAVECWLLEVESAMKRAVHTLVREALTAYPRSARTDWILQWPGQLVLNCSQARTENVFQAAMQSPAVKCSWLECRPEGL